MILSEKSHHFFSFHRGEWIMWETDTSKDKTRNILNNKMRLSVCNDSIMLMQQYVTIQNMERMTTPLKLRDSSKANRWFSPDVIADMLVHRTKEKKVFWEFDSNIMQNVSHNLLLFCAPTWPSYHVIENNQQDMTSKKRIPWLHLCLCSGTIHKCPYFFLFSWL